MQTRCKRPPVELTNGPAKATKALGINLSWNRYDMCAPDARLFLADGEDAIETTLDTRPRVGLGNTPEPWRSLPWNYRM